MTYTTFESPVGLLTAVGRDGGLAGLYLENHRHQPDPATFGERDDRAFTEVRRQLSEYFAGERAEFDLALTMRGTPFQQTVWRELTRIPYGETITYRELAEQIGKPGAFRAVGLANGRNPVSIVVPCHRVIGSNGDLTGYGGGVARKRRLLELESG
ncbi:methylated-DNA-[protein]-cysteine S-methyltransferase [Amycolatopsis sulphurea]|uniref:Methylated-DNA--protein-cysteine methyltransferase n=1 Tax=Amycolatopsis sulphurea TaxID=76022 RepID=A0A2A9FGX2_9PSEU|nr:methylated-DNA--[protein]-cysteine S-methyltransferase [Amycolatopsis sulphurea]PFG49822.1 methylated-DNA-[protein]-cysteine S-methyltransferase [Amycolatopsis sulphurea]